MAIALLAVAVTVTDAVKGRLTVLIKHADFTGNSRVLLNNPAMYVNVTAINKEGRLTNLTEFSQRIQSHKPVWNQRFSFGYANWKKLQISVNEDYDDFVIPVFTRYIVK